MVFNTPLPADECERRLREATLPMQSGAGTWKRSSSDRRKAVLSRIDGRKFTLLWKPSRIVRVGVAGVVWGQIAEANRGAVVKTFAPMPLIAAVLLPLRPFMPLTYLTEFNAAGLRAAFNLLVSDYLELAVFSLLAVAAVIITGVQTFFMETFLLDLLSG